MKPSNEATRILSMFMVKMNPPPKSCSCTKCGRIMTHAASMQRHIREKHGSHR